MNSTGDDRTFQFHLEEYKQLKSEIMLQQKLRFQIEIYTASAVFITLNYLFLHVGNLPGKDIKIMWWIPIFVVVTGFSISTMISRGVFIAGSYLKEIEAEYGKNGQGWETYLRPDGEKRKGVLSILISKMFFWIFLAGISLSVALFMTFAM